jgi:maleate isomerase
MLALNEILERTSVRRLGLVTPYLDELQTRIVANYSSLGIECVAERHLGVSDNFSFSEVSERQIRDMTAQVAAARPDAIAIVCTNLRGAPLADELEHELGVPVCDSVSTAVWKSLLLAGIDARRVIGWGRLFREPG